MVLLACGVGPFGQLNREAESSTRIEAVVVRGGSTGTGRGDLATSDELERNMISVGTSEERYQYTGRGRPLY